MPINPQLSAHIWSIHLINTTLCDFTFRECNSFADPECKSPAVTQYPNPITYLGADMITDNDNYTINLISLRICRSQHVQKIRGPSKLHLPESWIWLLLKMLLSSFNERKASWLTEQSRAAATRSSLWLQFVLYPIYSQFLFKWSCFRCHKNTHSVLIELCRKGHPYLSPIHWRAETFFLAALELRCLYLGSSQLERETSTHQQQHWAKNAASLFNYVEKNRLLI